MSNKNNSKSNSKNNSNSIVKMRGGAGIPLPPPPPSSFSNYTENKPPNNILQEDLFQIIKKDINNIVEKIKERLGKDIPETNENAKNIKDFLNNLSNEIYNLVNAIPININTIRIIKDDDGINQKDFVNNSYYKNFLISAQNLKVDPNIVNMNTIDKVNPTKFYNAPDKDENDINKINDRLRNCQNLEMLYLIKHEELMTTFAFTLNIFDKYKYAIKIILLLLKSLVYKKNGKSTLSVLLPKPVIEKIPDLLSDQASVQGIIDKMKETLINDPDTNNTILPGTKKNIKILQKIVNHTPPGPPPSESNINIPINNNDVPEHN